MEVDPPPAPATVLAPLPLPPILAEGSPSPPPTPTRNVRTPDVSDQTQLLAFLDTIMAAPEISSTPQAGLPQPTPGQSDPAADTILAQNDNMLNNIPSAVRDLLLSNPMGFPSPPGSQSTHDPLANYTNAIMPPTHLPHPAALFAFFDRSTIIKWWGFGGSKLLITPFDCDIKNENYHKDVGGCILAAIEEITRTKSATVVPPPPNPKAVNAGQIPRTFIVYNLSESHRQTLLQRQVWAAANFTFRVAPLEPSCPDYLFTIKGFTTLNEGSALKLVKDVWNDDTTTGFIQSIIEETPAHSRSTRKQALTDFLNSLWIASLGIRTKGHRLNPEFNVFAKGTLIQDINLWPKIRLFLAERPYLNEDLGQGTVVIAPYNCHLCHGCDHPRGLCPFPLIKGWPGPKHTRAQNPGSKRPAPRRLFPRTR